MATDRPSSSYPELTPVQETSLLVAYWRYLETVRQDTEPMIQDLPAIQLVENLLPQRRKAEFHESSIRECGQDILAVRTRCIDNWIQEGPNENDERQLVNLGAGMCARYYRLNLSDQYSSMWEVDSDRELLDIKDQVLRDKQTSALPRVLLEADLGNVDDLIALESKLPESSFQVCRPTDWIIEGVLEYVSPDQHASILEFAGKMSAPGSRLIAQVLEEPLRDYFANVLKAADLPWQKLPPLSTFESCANSGGWNVDQVIEPKEWSQLYGRDISYVPGFNMVLLSKTP